uniref:Nicotinic acetylcholine receptor non-alpha subunit 27 n=2 Tax=Parascaris equorum TaxID=6256 RepID=A0A0U2ES47_PAREQ|nr:nicotinic acetylcholine receptor non-alpha subunit 27 [Parascaris equorum]
MLCIMAAVILLIAADEAIELPPIPDRSKIADVDLKKFGINDEQRLFKHILRNYDISVRPVINASTVVNVYMGLTLTHIFNIDERSQVLALNIWVEQSWHDERIHWDPAEFGNISKLTVAIRYVWTPDIVLYNNARDFSRGFVDTNLHILSNGDLQWAPPAKVYSICKLDVTFFPFDDQFCVLEFGSWIYDRSQLDVQIMERYDGKDPFTRDSFTENGEWEIVANRTRKLLRGRHTIFPTIVFELHLRRRMLYFLYNIIAPCVMLSVLTMMQFMLPCESGEKVTLGLTVLLAYSVFSFNIAENMPETSEVIPLIAIYLMGIMGISALSVCLSVAVLNMRHGAERKCNVPPWLNFLAYRVLGRFFGAKQPPRKTKPRVMESSKDRLSQALMERAENEQHLDELIQQWSQLAIIFDRFFFCCVFLFTVSTTAALLLLAPRFSHRSFDSHDDS